MATREEYKAVVKEAMQEMFPELIQKVRARNIQYNIYKGKGGKFGAVQFSVKPGNIASDNIKDRSDGRLFIQAAKATAPDVYDWNNKIILGFNVDELGELMNSLVRGQELKLFHKSSKSKHSKSNADKQLWLSPGTGDYAGTFLLNLSEEEGQRKEKILIPISKGEVRTLYNLFSQAQALMLGWL